MELSGRGKEWNSRRNWADFGPNLNSGSSSHLTRHQQGRLAAGVVRPGGAVEGPEGGLGGLQGGLGGLQGGLGGLQGGLGGLAAGRSRPAIELPSVCD